MFRRILLCERRPHLSRSLSFWSDRLRSTFKALEAMPPDLGEEHLATTQFLEVFRPWIWDKELAQESVPGFRKVVEFSFRANKDVEFLVSMLECESFLQLCLRDKAFASKIVGILYKAKKNREIIKFFELIGEIQPEDEPPFDNVNRRNLAMKYLCYDTENVEFCLEKFRNLWYLPWNDEVCTRFVNTCSAVGRYDLLAEFLSLELGRATLKPIQLTLTLKFLTREKFFEKAQYLFLKNLDNIDNPDIKLFTQYLMCCLQDENPCVDSALQVVELIENYSVKPDIYFYTLAVKICVKTKRSQEALDLLNKVQKSGIKISDTFFSTMYSNFLLPRLQSDGEFTSEYEHLIEYAKKLDVYPTEEAFLDVLRYFSRNYSISECVQKSISFLLEIQEGGQFLVTSKLVKFSLIQLEILGDYEILALLINHIIEYQWKIDLNVVDELAKLFRRGVLNSSLAFTFINYLTKDLQMVLPSSTWQSFGFALIDSKDFASAETCLYRSLDQGSYWGEDVTRWLLRSFMLGDDFELNLPAVQRILDVLADKNLIFESSLLNLGIRGALHQNNYDKAIQWLKYMKNHNFPFDSYTKKILNKLEHRSHKALITPKQYAMILEMLHSSKS